ncbi:MAG: hypothetical protein E6K81_01470 [Candidatus Eisenbacteria bacterium]|uniref:Uncharacterized protein n=1 Tax=Eiseniibacteriota bacterium TaxID=2212470 RepID=A0A538UDX8_UNCEI|nr:MAG: hypothetical protein E6K81_01470 [Candidatus Eisenbacteria bacterium]
MSYGVFDPRAGPWAPGSILRDLALLLVGWVLGIVSSPVTDAIRRRSAKQRLTRALRTELRSLQDTLAWAVVQIDRRRGVLTHSLLEVLMSTLQASGQVPGQGKALKAIEGLLQLDELAPTANLAPDPTPPRAPLSLRVFGVPFLDTHIHRLDLYALDTQRQLVEIHTGLAIYNQHADEATNYHQLSFAEGLAKDRLDALTLNLETSYQRAGERASDLVSRIAVLLQEAEMKNA